MKKENIYLDMSKLTEKQQKKVISLLPNELYKGDYKVSKYYYKLHYYMDVSWFVDLGIEDKFECSVKKEITYKEFKKLIKKENKEKFVLPEKWCVKNKEYQDLIDYSNEHGAIPPYSVINDAYFHFPYFLMGGSEYKGTTSNIIEQGFTEITIKQFRKYVLKKKKVKKNKYNESKN